MKASPKKIALPAFTERGMITRRRLRLDPTVVPTHAVRDVRVAVLRAVDLDGPHRSRRTAPVGADVPFTVGLAVHGLGVLTDIRNLIGRRIERPVEGQVIARVELDVVTEAVEAVRVLDEGLIVARALGPDLDVIRVAGEVAALVEVVVEVLFVVVANRVAAVDPILAVVSAPVDVVAELHEHTRPTRRRGVTTIVIVVAVRGTAVIVVIVGRRRAVIVVIFDHVTAVIVVVATSVRNGLELRGLGVAPILTRFHRLVRVGDVALRFQTTTRQQGQ